jgi:hypothetical protein
MVVGCPVEIEGNLAAYSTLVNFLPMLNKDSVNLSNPGLKDRKRFRAERVKRLIKVGILVAAWQRASA